jgi:hypothetical protein
MKEVESNIASLMNRAGEMFRARTGTVDCESAQELMSPFIDSMASAEQAESLQRHLDQCAPCRRQLQSFISVRNLLTRIEQPAPPEDLVLDTRVKLSQERNKNYLARLENRISNILKPIAIPAIAGVSLTMLFFGILLGGLISDTTVMARERFTDDRPIAAYKFVRTTDPTMIRFAKTEANNWDEPLMIETHVSDDGKVIDYRIISGPKSPEMERWVRDLLYFAHFTPATSYGRPVDAKIILSFVAVRS